jgi:hypothetical protein
MKIVKSILILSLICLFSITGCRDIFGDGEQPDSIVQVPNEPEEIIVTSPTRGSIYKPGDVIRISWFANSISNIDLELYRKSDYKFTISDNQKNTGIFDWQIPIDINLSNHYIIKIVNYNNPDAYQFSGMFGIQ